LETLEIHLEPIERTSGSGLKVDDSCWNVHCCQKNWLRL